MHDKVMSLDNMVYEGSNDLHSTLAMEVTKFGDPGGMLPEVHRQHVTGMSSVVLDDYTRVLSIKFGEAEYAESYKEALPEITNDPTFGFPGSFHISYNTVIIIEDM